VIRINLAQSVPLMVSGAVENIEGVNTDIRDIQRQGAIRLVTILLLPLALFAYEFQNIPTLNDKLRRKSALLQDLRAKNEQAKGAVEEIKRFKEDQSRLQKQIDTLEGLQRERLLEVKILDNLQKDIPEKVWLERVDFKDENMVISGLAVAGQDLTAFYENLSKSVFLEEVQLVKESEQMNDKGVLRKFEISCRMDRSVPATKEVAR